MSKLLKAVLATNVAGTFVFETGATVVAKMNDGVTEVSLTETPASSGIYQLTVTDEGIYNIWVDGVDSGLTARAGKLNGYDIQNLTIGTGHLVAESVTNAKVAADAINTTQIVDDAVTNDKLADDAVDTDQLVDDAVTIDKIANSAVGTNQIADDAVTNDKLADDAVNTDQLVDDAVTIDKMAANSVGSVQIEAGGVEEANLDTDAVTEAKIKALSVTMAKLAAAVYAEAATVSTLVKRTAHGDVQGVVNRASEAEELNTTIGGAISRKFQTLAVTGMNGNPSFDITFTDTGIGDRVLGVLLRVNVGLGQTWSADFVTNPSAQSIAAAGQAAAANTKITKMYDPNANTDLNPAGSTVVRITADAGNFGAGSMQAVLFYETLTELEDYGA